MINNNENFETNIKNNFNNKPGDVSVNLSGSVSDDDLKNARDLYSEIKNYEAE
jgi:hypothetical protein